MIDKKKTAPKSPGSHGSLSHPYGGSPLGHEVGLTHH